MTRGNQAVAAYASVGASFAAFCGIFLYQSWQCVVTSRALKQFLRWFHHRRAACMIDNNHEFINLCSDATDDHEHQTLPPIQDNV